MNAPNVKLTVVLEAYQILTKRQKIKLLTIGFSQVLVNFLDLIGVALIGMLGAMTVSGIQSKKSGTRVTNILEALNINHWAFQNQVAVIGITAALVLISRTLFSIIFTRKTLFFMGAVSAKLSSDLIAKVLNNNILLLQSITSQKMSFSLTTGANAITLGILGATSTLISDVSLLIILVIGLFIINPFIAIITCLIFLGVALFLYFILEKRVFMIGKESTKLNIESNERIFEIIMSYREIFARNRQFFYYEKLSKNRYDLSSSSAEAAFIPNISKYVIELALIISTLIVSAMQFLTSNAVHSIAVLSIFLAAGARIAPAVLRIQQGLLSVKNNAAIAEPTLDLIKKLGKTRNLVKDPRGYEIIQSGFTPLIVASNLTFNYGKESKFSLTDVSFTLLAGESLAIVGPTGSGKTTLVDLIIGIQDLCSGDLLVSGYPPAESIRKWPGAISYIPQDIVIVNGTIRSNICLGYEIEYDNDEVFWDVLRKAHLSDLVKALPNGLDTQVGDRGTKLSGGQRQRLGIARALFNNPKLLILDEATSALDSETEYEINQTIKHLKGSVTIIIIAHRLSSVKNADKVLYLNGGKMLAIGTFNEVREIIPDFDRQARLMGI